MIRELLVMLTEDATWTLPELADRLNSDPQLVTMALEECRRLGYVERIAFDTCCGSCGAGGGDCHSRKPAGCCPSHDEPVRPPAERETSPGWWQLTQAGRAAAGRAPHVSPAAAGRTPHVSPAAAGRTPHVSPAPAVR